MKLNGTAVLPVLLLLLLLLQQSHTDPEGAVKKNSPAAFFSYVIVLLFCSCCFFFSSNPRDCARSLAGRQPHHFQEAVITSKLTQGGQGCVRDSGKVSSDGFENCVLDIEA